MTLCAVAAGCKAVAALDIEVSNKGNIAVLTHKEK